MMTGKVVLLLNDLTPFDRWMVRSNLRTIQQGEDRERVVSLLRAGGYNRVAAAVEVISANAKD